MSEMDYDTALALVRSQIANEGESFVYKSPITYGGCYNVVKIEAPFETEYRPSCMVGRVYADFGIDPEEMYEKAASQSVRAAADRLSIELTDKAAIFLQRFQDEQDRKVPWGTALTVAMEFAEDYMSGLYDE